MRVHPLAEVKQNAITSLIAVQRFELVPMLPLRAPNKVKDSFGKDRSFPVEFTIRDALVIAAQQAIDQHCFKCSFGMRSHQLTLASFFRNQYTTT